MTNSEEKKPSSLGICSFCGEEGDEMLCGPDITKTMPRIIAEPLAKICTELGIKDEEAGSFLNPARVRICVECAAFVFSVFAEHEIKTSENYWKRNGFRFTPKRLLNHLSKHVIGQMRAKKALSLAAWQHFARLRAEDCPHLVMGKLADVELDKTNILLIGPTGCGKTLLVQTIAKYLEIPFVTFDASTVTPAGYKGADAADCVKKLVMASGGDVMLAQRGVIYLDEIDKLRQQYAGGARDMCEGAQQALLKIIEGGEVTIEIGEGQSKEEVTVDTRGILFVASGAFPDLAKIVDKRKAKKGMGFLGTPKEEVNESVALASVTTEDLVKYGLLAEFIGRFTTIATLDALTREEMIRILCEPKNALVHQYEKRFALEGVQVRFTRKVLEEVADEAMTKKTGARALGGVFADRFSELMFVLPELAHTRRRVALDPNMLKGALLRFKQSGGKKRARKMIYKKAEE